MTPRDRWLVLRSLLVSAACADRPRVAVLEVLRGTDGLGRAVPGVPEGGLDGLAEELLGVSDRLDDMLSDAEDFRFR